MEIVYRQAFAEVLEVLKHTSKSIVQKIPEKFLIYLKENKDNEYIVNINFSKKNWEDDIKEETQAILALIYRDYIVSPDTKNKLIQEEIEEQIRIENEIREKYNPDNIFKKVNNLETTNNIEIPEDNNNTALIEYKESFFIRFKNFIFRILNINK